MKKVITLLFVSLVMSSVSQADVVIRDKKDPLWGTRVIIKTLPNSEYSYQECQVQKDDSLNCTGMFNGKVFTAEELTLSAQNYLKRSHRLEGGDVALGGVMGGMGGTLIGMLGGGILMSSIFTSASLVPFIGIPLAVGAIGTAAVMYEKGKATATEELNSVADAENNPDADIEVDNINSYISETQNMLTSTN